MSAANSCTLFAERSFALNSEATFLLNLLLGGKLSGSYGFALLESMVAAKLEFVVYRGAVLEREGGRERSCAPRGAVLLGELCI